MQDDAKILRRLENKALHYLGRYASTEARLHEVLLRFSKRKMPMVEPERLEPLIGRIIADCVAKGYVDDKAFAEQKTSSLRQKGNSRLHIKQKLYGRGVNPDIINDAIDAHDDDQPYDAEICAALTYARKRRLGPYARPPSGQSEMKEGWYRRHYASLARAGFSQRIAATIMALETPDQAEKFFDEMLSEDAE